MEMGLICDYIKQMLAKPHPKVFFTTPRSLSLQNWVILVISFSWNGSGLSLGWSRNSVFHPSFMYANYHLIDIAQVVLVEPIQRLQPICVNVHSTQNVLSDHYPRHRNFPSYVIDVRCLFPTYIPNFISSAKEKAVNGAFVLILSLFCLSNASISESALVWWAGKIAKKFFQSVLWFSISLNPQSSSKEFFFPRLSLE